MKTVVAFGEILGRLSPPNGERFRQALPGRLDLTFGGAEANVAASLSLLGGRARLVSALPCNSIADSCVSFYAGLHLDTRFLLRRDHGRLGLYFYENGANQRPGEVTYDRSGSTLSLTPAEGYPWEAIFENAEVLFMTGITPGVSEIAAHTALVAAQEAAKRGVRIIFDLNFRRKLWQWKPSMSPEALACETLTPILELTSLLIANEGSANDVFGIQNDDESKTPVESSTEIARILCGKFPNLSAVAMTLRTSLSASHNRWGALLYERDPGVAHSAPLVEGNFAPYDIPSIVDRIGAGDAFAAGLIYALSTPELCSPDRAIAFATAASCLCHSIPGDINYATRAEVEALINGGGSGRIVR